MKKTIILICVIGIFLVGGCEKKQSSIQNVNTEETTRNISNQEKDTNNSDDNFEVRIFASYQTCKGDIWIITEADRSATTVLFPDEY